MIATIKLTLVLFVTRDYHVFMTAGNVIVTQYVYTHLIFI